MLFDEKKCNYLTLPIIFIDHVGFVTDWIYQPILYILLLYAADMHSVFAGRRQFNIVYYYIVLTACIIIPLKR